MAIVRKSWWRLQGNLGGDCEEILVAIVRKSWWRLCGNPNNEGSSTATATVRTNGLTLICRRKQANKQKEPRDTKCERTISQENIFSLWVNF